MKTAILLFTSVLLMANSMYAQSVPKQDQLRKTTSDGCANMPLLEKRVEDMETRLRDWPELSRYAGADAKLPPPAAGEPRVVFMGDSITDGWSNPQFGGFFPGKPYVNRGISANYATNAAAFPPRRNRPEAAGRRNPRGHQ